MVAVSAPALPPPASAVSSPSTASGSSSARPSAAVVAPPGQATSLGQVPAASVQAFGAAAAALGVGVALAGRRRASRRSCGGGHGLRGRACAAGHAAAAAVALKAPVPLTSPSRSSRSTVGRAAAAATASPEVAEAATTETGNESEIPSEPTLPARPLQIVKIDLETNSVVVGEEEIRQLEAALKRSGAEKVAVVGVMGAFRTGKSFLLDLMLRYMREKSIKKEASKPEQGEDCEVPAWILENGVPDWAVNCGDSLVEGREGRAAGDTELNGFLWRPGMDKCTEGVWVWSEAFVCRAGDEDVAVLLMDTQGAWDAKMSKEQSATVFGLTTLMASRLVYNVSKQIQQDKIDNLLYFTEFAQAALRAKAGFSTAEGQIRPFQTLEFLVRDWPHYADGSSVEAGRKMMLSHLDQYMDPKVSEDTQSIDTLQKMFENLDVWCLPHPSLTIERESWDGDLKVIEPQFWRFIDQYFEKIFSSKELSAKTTLGTPITVDTFRSVLQEFILAFQNAAPQAQTFAEAMETSTSLLARDSALKLLRKSMTEESSDIPDALAPEDFERVATEVAGKVEAEFDSKAIYGSEENIRKVGEDLKEEVKTELDRYREENSRKLEASLTSLTNVSLAAVGAFGVDKVSDLTCDWWSGVCRDLSNDLAFGYSGVILFVLYSLNKINTQRGQLDAAVAAMELGKSMAKKANGLIGEAKAAAKETQEKAKEKA